ncbi:MAG: isoprenylcysteine carboxylmethyltransferase family protein [Spirochaetes bacterium]|nr:isoprenylcysteine carboxylmethyltransferase family protein [Spirochaetota bacterium]
MNRNKASSRYYGRKDLAGEHPFGDAGQLILFFIFIFIWIFDSFIIKFSQQYFSSVPIYVNLPIGIILFIISFLLAKTSLSIVFGEKRDPPAVISKSVFGLVRHPVYLSALLLYLGLIVSTLSILSFLFIIVIFIFYNYIASHEEKKLIALFGKDYKEYMKKVPRWIPGLFG